MPLTNNAWQENIELIAASTGALSDSSASGSVTNLNDTVAIVLPGGQSTALVQITGTFVGTLLFEASPDNGTTWYSVIGSQSGTSSEAISATTTGVWRVGIAGFTNFRVRLNPVTSGTATIALRLSSGIHNVFVNNASTLGQTVMSSSSPVVIASDQTAIKIKADFTEIAGNAITQSASASGSGAVAGADYLTQMDVSAYKWFSVQLAGTWSATFTFQCSNDNTNWITCNAQTCTLSLNSTNTATTSNIYYGSISFRYLRVRCTTFSSNTSLTGNIELYTTTPPMMAVTVAQTGTWTVQPGNTQNTTPWLLQGPTTTGTQAANTAGNVVIKGSAGALWNAVVTATGTAGLDVFDNASTNSGTKLLSIPANAAVGSVYSFAGGQPAASGIVSAGVANCPAVTFGYR